jgi:hypothetical protein
VYTLFGPPPPSIPLLPSSTLHSLQLVFATYLVPTWMMEGPCEAMSLRDASTPLPAHFHLPADWQERWRTELHVPLVLFYWAFLPFQPKWLATEEVKWGTKWDGSLSLVLLPTRGLFLHLEQVLVQMGNVCSLRSHWNQALGTGDTTSEQATKSRQRFVQRPWACSIIHLAHRTQMTEP